MPASDYTFWATTRKRFIVCVAPGVLRPILLLLLSAMAVLLLAACSSRHPVIPSVPSPVQTIAERRSTAAVDVRQIFRPITAEEAQDYLGDAVCASCHKEAAEAHRKSRHAQTLRPVTIAKDGLYFRAANSVTDSHLRYTYAPVVSKGRCALRGQNAKGKTAELTADYVMGSGHNAFTYLSRETPTQWVELRLSYYPKVKTWDYTPTQLEGANLPRAAGKSQSDDELTGCLLCHVTTLRLAPSPVDANGMPTSHPNPDMKASLLGVGCERCHGSGRAHVEQATRAHASTPELLARAKAAGQTYGMEDLSKATPDAINNLCGVCHRTPSNAVSGDSHTEMNLARFQGVALARSACYQKSGTLSCLTCHAAHSNADTNPAHNDAICLRCHSATATSQTTGETQSGQQNVQATHSPTPNTGRPREAKDTPPTANTVCPVNPRTGCTNCHMPGQTIADIPHVRYTNHWIKVWPGTSAISPNAQASAAGAN